MRILSLFDGISCGRVALDRAGIKVDQYYASEIDKYAIQVSKANWPDIVQLGDVTQVKGENLPKIDILVGGSPCQNLSVSGDKTGLDGVSSKLFWEYARIFKQLKDLNPELLFLLENVKMKKEWCDIITRELGVEPVIIDSGDFTAQKRIRYYWCNWQISGISPKNVLFRDICEQNVEGFDLGRGLVSRYRQTSPDDGSKMEIGTTRFEGRIGQRDRVYGVNNKIPTLMATDYKQPKQVLVNGSLRKLTPVEAERLQGFPDGYTDCISITQRYKCLGNSWTVDVIAHILKGII